MEILRIGVRGALLLPLLLVAGGVRAEPPPALPAPPDPGAVSAAIDRGVRYLTGFYAKHPLKSAQERELILYVLLHGGVKPDHPLFKQCLAGIEADSPRNTYNAALSLMLFHRLDPVKYRFQIARGAEFLVQSQCANGQWTYTGNPVPLRRDYEVHEREAPYLVYAAAPGERPRAGVGEAVGARCLKGFRIPAQRDPRRAPAVGDNSNTQYAVLGLRAAAESGCLIPDETWKRASDGFRRIQNADGGLGYDISSTDPFRLASTHTMTTAGVAVLAICDFYLKIDPASDAALMRMQEWLAGKFDVKTSTSVFKDGNAAHYYYLYGLERAGTLLGKPGFGGRDWYREGAAWLLSQQRKDGSWQVPSRWPNEANTAFAILFLSRSTLPLIPDDKRKAYEIGFPDEPRAKGR